METRKFGKALPLGSSDTQYGGWPSTVRSWAPTTRQWCSRICCTSAKRAEAEIRPPLASCRTLENRRAARELTCRKHPTTRGAGLGIPTAPFHGAILLITTVFKVWELFGHPSSIAKNSIDNYKSVK